MENENTPTLPINVPEKKKRGRKPLTDEDRLTHQRKSKLDYYYRHKQALIPLNVKHHQKKVQSIIDKNKEIFHNMLQEGDTVMINKLMTSYIERFPNYFVRILNSELGIPTDNNEVDDEVDE